MTKIEKVAYAAGLIDGEGCFTFSRSPKRKDGTTYPQPLLIVQMTDPETVYWLQELFSGAAYKTAARPRAEIVFAWKLVNREQLGVVTLTLLPYLRIKRLPAMIILDFLKRFPQPSLADPETTKQYYNFMAVANGTGVGSAQEKAEFLRLVTGT